MAGPCLAPGVVPAEVGRIQAALKELGYYSGAVDSLSGPQTRAAMDAFRRAEGAQALSLSALVRLAEQRAAERRVVVTPPPPPPPEDPPEPERGSDFGQ